MRMWWSWWSGGEKECPLDRGKNISQGDLIRGCAAELTPTCRRKALVRLLNQGLVSGIRPTDLVLEKR